MRAAVLSIPRVQLDVTVPRPLVLKQARAEIAAERHLVRVRLEEIKHSFNYNGDQYF